MTNPSLDPRRPVSGRNRLISVILLLLSIVAAFYPIVHNQFVGWDDPGTIYENPFLNPPTWHGAAHYFAHGDPGLFAPFTYLFWSFLALIGHMNSPGSDGEHINPLFFHVSSLLLHTGCVLLVLKILRRRIGFSLFAATIGAALFALHPLQVETVAWATAQKDLLCTIFSLAAIDQYLAYREQNARNHYFAAWIALLFSLFCKPAAVITPIILMVLDRWIARQSWRAIAKSVWPFFVIIVPFVIAARIMQTLTAVKPTPIWSRPLVAGDALTFYLEKLIWPLNLACDYGRTPTKMLQTSWIYFARSVPILLAGILWTRRRKARPVAFGAAIFVLTLLPVLGLSPFMYQTHSTTADHYVYFPMLGVAICLAWIVQRWHPLRWIAIAMLITCAILSNLQSRTWENSLTMFGHAVQVVPDNAAVQANFGNSLARAGLLDQAMPHFIRSIQLDPEYRLGYLCLAQAALQQGRFEDAISQAQTSISLIRGSDEPGKEHLIIGLSLMRLNRPREAADEFRRALLTEPDNQMAHQQLKFAMQQSSST